MASSTHVTSAANPSVVWTRLMASGLAAVFAVFTACADDALPVEPCSDIPAGGCPLSRGLACEDPACEAAYACRPGGRWELDHVCPPNPDSKADADTDAQATDGESADAATFDATDMDANAPEGAYGGPGCEALLPPDCMVGFALACPSGCCGCEDLFVCKKGAWYAWGTCSEDGGVSLP